MRLFRNYKYYSYENGVKTIYNRHLLSLVGMILTIILIAAILFIVAVPYSGYVDKKPLYVKDYSVLDYLAYSRSKIDILRDKNLGVHSSGSFTLVDNGNINSGVDASYTHKGVVSTIFWVGEIANVDNGYIANKQSAWDSQWQTHYGGVDDPNNRNGYYPSAFVPKENPFYFALPYNDINDNGNRKVTATNCQQINQNLVLNYSWCKNSWIKISKNNKVAYAQWQDVGPFVEDDASYVFGDANPANTFDSKAGLDISPAVATFLGASDVDRLDWSFVLFDEVSQGPWLNIVTTTRGYYVDR